MDAPKGQRFTSAFWMVWREDSGRCSYKHKSKAEALKEAERARQEENRKLIRALDLANAKLTNAATQEREKVIVNERRILVQNPNCDRWSDDEFKRLHRLRKTRRSRGGN